MAPLADPRGFGERVRALALVLLTACSIGCSTDARIRLLEPLAMPDAAMPMPDAALPAPDAAEPAPDAGPPSVGLALRYDFEGTGTLVEDRVGTADAQLLGGAVLDGAGGVELDGDDDYVDLPNGVLSRHRSVTIVAWLTWHGGVCWQRIFDFGSNDAGEGQVGNSLTSLYLTATNCVDDTYFASVELGTMRQGVYTSAPLPSERLTQAALSFDAASETLSLYVDGVRVGRKRTPFRLSDIDDVNAWLGRSQWVQDRNLGARYDELRIYDYALTDAELAAMYARGPDAP